MRKKRIKKKIEKTNYNSNATSKAFAIITFLLMFIGLIAIADASAPAAVRSFNDKYHFLKQQAIWAFLGSVSFVVLSRLNYKVWERYGNLIFFASLLGLVLVFIPGLGVTAYGAKRWFLIAGNSFQPSEFVKLTILIYLAKVSYKEKSILSYLIPIFLVCLLVVLQPDLGTTLVIASASMIQVFVSGVDLLKVISVSVMGALASLLLILTSAYRKERLLTYLSESQDPLGKGYHVRQILLALGSGGMWGVGFGASRQKFLFLPETATDSIFAIIAEEIGFVGAMLIIMLYMIYIFFGFRIAINAKDKFAQVLATGIMSWITLQTVFNLGSMVSLIPLTGIPLPFISYGGSALLAVMSASGILLNISRNTK